jgi:hypothetical protein
MRYLLLGATLTLSLSVLTVQAQRAAGVSVPIE